MIISTFTGRELWSQYFAISDSVRRVRDSGAEPIPPSEFLAWQILENRSIRPEEYRILRAMDKVFVEGVDSNISDYHEKMKRDMEAKQN